MPVEVPSVPPVDGLDPVYFEVSELRELPDMANEAKYPDGRAVAARDWITAIIERVCGTSFVHRGRTEKFDNSTLGRDGRLRLADLYPLQLVAVTFDDGITTLDESELANLAIRAGGAVVRWKSQYDFDFAWHYGHRSTEITYVAGYTAEPPADIKEAALQAARYRLISVDGASGIPSRALSLTNEFGNISLATASAQRPTGIPDVDAVILDWAQRIRVPSVA